MKYQDAISNAATLTYGICNNHPFHNGNKRTALVSLLVHLDKNKLTLLNTNQRDLYKFMINIADHTLGLKIDKRKKDQNIRRDPDDEVSAIVEWLNSHVYTVSRGEKAITHKQLKAILHKFGFELENPGPTKIDVVKYKDETIPGGLFTRKKINRVRNKIVTISWLGEKDRVHVEVIKKLRRACKLTEEDGCDSDAFYQDAQILDNFVNTYRKCLKNLAKT